MTHTATLNARAAATGGSWAEAVAFHFALVVLLVWSQIALVATREMGADNTWHFLLARDVMSGASIHWAAVDANRLFPDLPLALAAYALSGGEAFAAWVAAYQALYILLLYASLLVLGAYLFEEAGPRRLFLLCAALAFTGLSVLFPYWSGWLVIPGNHGGTVPVALLCLAGLFALTRSGRNVIASLFAFGLLIVALVAPNRVLLVKFVATLASGLLVAAILRAVAGGGGRAAPLASAIALTVAGGLCGYALWRAISTLDWHKLVAPGNRAQIRPSVGWLAERLQKEVSELGRSLSHTWEVWAGVAFLGLTVIVAVLLLVRAARRGTPTAAAENITIFGLLAAFSGLAGLAFITFVNDDTDIWRYRFLAAPIAFALVFFSAWLGRAAAPLLRVEVLAALVVPLVLALSLFSARSRQLAPAQNEATFARSIGDLTRMIGQHVPGRPLRGYANYWLANDLGPRSSALRLGMIDPDRPEFRFYNNNAADALCSGDHAFILYHPVRDVPRKAALLAQLGEPIRTEGITLSRHGAVEVFYYAPATIEARITRPGREAAARLFPKFRCSP